MPLQSAMQDYFGKYNVSPTTQAFIGSSHQLYIGGQWVEGTGGEAEVLEPSTGEILTRIARASVEDVDLAVHAAREQFDHGEWSRIKPLERERYLFKLADAIELHADELAEIESIDVGKPLKDAREIDIQGTIDTFRYFAGWASKLYGRSIEASSLPGEYLAYTRKEPVGVIGVIIPWNFPLQTLSWKLGAALAAGCTVVIKPAELTSLSALRFAALVDDVGFPPGVVNVITGSGSVAGNALAGHPGINKVTFTGSTKTGKSVGRAALENMTRMTLELGGKSPVLVFPDCDMDNVIQRVAEGIFGNSGQVCDAGSRAYIHESIYDDFMNRLSTYAQGLKVGPGLDPDSFMGPLVSEGQKERVTGYIASGIEEGARLVCGGENIPGKGYFVPPTVFADCTNSMKIVREEIFGPVLVCQKFSTEEEAIELANDSEYGLAATIYSTSLSRVHRVAARLQAGTVYVNAQSTIDPVMPFGGYKSSGFGRDLGPEQFDDVTETKTVWLTLE